MKRIPSPYQFDSVEDYLAACNAWEREYNRDSLTGLIFMIVVGLLIVAAGGCFA